VSEYENVLCDLSRKYFIYVRGRTNFAIQSSFASFPPDSLSLSLFLSLFVYFFVTTLFGVHECNIIHSARIEKKEREGERAFKKTITTIK
jgi:hypothetical protein